MSETKHTPGPWQLYGYIGESELSRVRACIGKDHAGREQYKDVPANSSDARLMAAAPEMLEALLRIRDSLCRTHSPFVVDSEYAFVSKAINKAKGTQ